MRLLIIQICAIDSKQCVPRNACKVIVQFLQVYHAGQACVTLMKEEDRESPRLAQLQAVLREF